MTGAAALLAGACGGALAQSIDCGGVYVIARGDILRAIAPRSYGTGVFQPIYQANAAVIGPNPNLIEVGTCLRIPCLDDAAAPAPAPQAATAGATLVAVTRPEPAAAIPATGGRGAQFIGVDGNAPFSDGDLAGGGLFIKLLSLAMQRSGADAGEIDFAPDWPAQLSALLPGGGYDVGFPWVRPDCDRPATLGAESRARCRSFDF
jgi:hypothetical protein